MARLQGIVSEGNFHIEPVDKSFLPTASFAPVGFAMRFQDHLFDHMRVAPNEAAYLIGRRKILILAGHAVNHRREGAIKWADLYTGSLAVSIGALVDTDCIVAMNLEEDDPNYYPQSPFRNFATKLAQQRKPQYILDLHGLESSKTDDLIIGTAGESPEREDFQIMKNAFETRGVKVIVSSEGAFSASTSDTLTRHFKNMGYKAMQIELHRRFRNPEADPGNYILALTALREATLFLAELEGTRKILSHTNREQISPAE